MQPGLDFTETPLLGSSRPFRCRALREGLRLAEGVWNAEGTGRDDNILESPRSANKTPPDKPSGKTKESDLSFSPEKEIERFFVTFLLYVIFIGGEGGGDPGVGYSEGLRIAGASKVSAAFSL